MKILSKHERTKSSSGSRARPHVRIDGRSLSISELVDLAEGEGQIAISSQALSAMRRSNEVVRRQAAVRPIYGVNTGFGPMVRRIISGQNLTDLQYNLLRSHATGLGTPIPVSFVRAAMLVRINTLAHGNSGVTPELVATFAELFNKGVTPVVPEHGAVGTSGDLVQLAHIALPVIGEGEVIYKGERRKAAEVLRSLNIQPHVLQPKEGLSLINGTAVMTGASALLVERARKLLDLELAIGACELEFVHAFTDIIDPILHELRPHPGQIEVASRLRARLRASRMLHDRAKETAHIAIENETYDSPELLQEVYSLRCIPQIMGPMYDTLTKVSGVIQTEVNSVTDNPVVDTDRELCLHGGNFHGDYIATAVDHLKIALVKLSLLSERRINFFLNKGVNGVLPPFLNLVQPGLTLALQGLQFVATSTAADNQSLGYPHSLHTISTNGDNQDIVSMGTDAALFAHKVLDNAYTIAAIELVTISQVAEHMKTEHNKLAPPSRELIEFVRQYVPPVYEDRVLSTEVERLKQVLLEGPIPSL